MMLLNLLLDIVINSYTSLGYGTEELNVKK